MDERIECATSSCGPTGHRPLVGSAQVRDGTDQSPTLGSWRRTGETRGAGVFITLEGPDGSGKSSLLLPLGSRDPGLGCDVVTTREPGSTPLGEQVRRLVLDTEPPIDRTGRADALLFAASRAQHVDEVIRPALARGAVVVCDRYADSSLAYQGAGSGVPMDELRAVQRFATGGLVPDLTILLDLPVEAGLGAEVGRGDPVRGVPRRRVPRAGARGVPRVRGRRARSATRSSTRRSMPTAVLAASRSRRRRERLGRAVRLPVPLGEPIGSGHACHDERRSPRTGGRAGAPAGSDRRGAPGRVGRRSSRGARRALRAIQDDGLRNRTPHHRRRRPRRGRRPGRVSRRVARAPTGTSPAAAA